MKSCIDALKPGDIVFAKGNHDGIVLASEIGYLSREYLVARKVDQIGFELYRRFPNPSRDKIFVGYGWLKDYVYRICKKS